LSRKARTLALSRAGGLFLLAHNRLYLGRGAQVYDLIHNWGAEARGDVERYYFDDGSALRVEKSPSEVWMDTGEPVVRLVPELTLAPL
jgi:hypothetical protein